MLGFQKQVYLSLYLNIYKLYTTPFHIVGLIGFSFFVHLIIHINIKIFYIFIFLFTSLNKYLHLFIHIFFNFLKHRFI